MNTYMELFEKFCNDNLRTNLFRSSHIVECIMGDGRKYLFEDSMNPKCDKILNLIRTSGHSNTIDELIVMYQLELDIFKVRRDYPTFISNNALHDFEDLVLSSLCTTTRQLYETL